MHFSKHVQDEKQRHLLHLIMDKTAEYVSSVTEDDVQPLLKKVGRFEEGFSLNESLEEHLRPLISSKLLGELLQACD
jgi:hypothetical protein